MPQPEIITRHRARRYHGRTPSAPFFHPNQRNDIMSQETLTQRIESRINRDETQSMGIGPAGHIAFSNTAQLMELSKMMAIASVAVPKHLRDNPGACLAVAIQASEWQMSPFAVANKSYSVNDRLAFESQLVNAVILRRAPIKGRFRPTYSGEGDSRKCKVEATLLDGEVVDYESPPIGKIPVKNSPLWKGDPDQQLFYYSSRAMCRRHFPDVLLGIYTPDEVEVGERVATGREVADDSPQAGMAAMLAGGKPAKTGTTEKPKAASKAKQTLPPASAEDDVLHLLDEIGYQGPEFVAAVRQLGITPSRDLNDISAAEWATALKRWEEVKSVMAEARNAAGDSEEAA